MHLKFQLINIITSYKKSFSGLHKNVWLISAVLFVNRVGSMVLMFTTLYLTTALHFTKSQAGLIMSCFGIGSIIGSYIGGWLADRYNQKNIMLFALIASGTILLTINYIKNPYGIGAILFFYAMFSDSFRPASSVAITHFSDAQSRTRSISLMRLAINLGFSIGPAIGGIVAHHIGYYYLFIMDACTSFLAAILLFYYFPSENLKATSTQTMNNLDFKTSAYQDNTYLKFVCLVALYGLCFFQLFTSVPTYFKQDCHYTEDLIGYLLAFNGLLVVCIEMPIVAYLEKFKKANLYITLGCIQIIIAYSLLVLSNGAIWISIIYTFFITMSEVFAMPFMMNYAMAKPIKERQGQYSALYSIAYGTSIIFAPSIGLYLAEHFGFDNMFLFFISLSSLIAFGFYKLVK